MRHGTCFRRRLSAHHAGAAPRSAAAELGVVRRFRAHPEMGYLIVTLLALALLALPVGYIRLCGAMRAAAIQHPPYLHFFFVFGAFGGFLVCAALAGSPIGAILSVIPLILAPLAILISSFIIYRRHRDSRFHSAAFWSGLAYVGLITVIFTVISSIES